MQRQKSLNKAQDTLLLRREELRSMVEKNNRQQERLHEPAIEFEERAQKAKTEQRAESDEKRLRDELFLVNHALQKIPAGSFGICEDCGMDIREMRIQAIPWTRWCLECARENEPEGASIRSIGATEEQLPHEFEEIGRIYLELRNHGLPAPNGIQVRKRENGLVLDGYVNNKTEFNMVQRVLEQNLGFEIIENNLRLREPEPLQPSTGKETSKMRDDEETMYGTPADEDYFEAAREGGASVMPPDELKPENDR